MTVAFGERSHRRSVPGLVVAAALVGVVLGAESLLPHRDDAFVTFRHVVDARNGHGLVWSAQPFPPAEGYISFL